MAFIFSSWLIISILHLHHPNWFRSLWILFLSSSWWCSWSLAGMNIGLQIRFTMVTWLFFKVKRKFFFPNPWRHRLMLTSNIPKSLSLPRRQIDWFWHLGIGWGDMATASLIGLALPTNNPCLPQCSQNIRLGFYFKDSKYLQWGHFFFFYLLSIAHFSQLLTFPSKAAPLWDYH